MDKIKEKPKILSQKTFLYLTEFFSGMSVMAAELGASRLLAPYFSSSQIVWTIIIGTIMIAMALGNVFGGKWADKDPDPDRLYRRILIAAVWLAAVPFLGKFVIIGISALLVLTVSTNFLIIAAFLTCITVFVFPLFLLGTVTPSLVKFTVGSLDENGRTVGMLNASNTIGSIIGTFIPTFVSIPAVGTAATFVIFAAVLLVIAAVYFISAKRGIGKTVTAAVLLAVFAVPGIMTGFAFWEKDTVYEGESVYNYLRVSEDESSVILSTNVLFGVQSIYMKDTAPVLTRMYYDYAAAAPLMTGEPDSHKDMLILGMGTGTFAVQCNKYFDDITTEGVEIDGKITELAGKYFHLPPEIEVSEYDRRAFLNVCKEKYDVIMVDAYQDITIPFQMSSVEFFTLVKDHLKEGGVMVVNMNMRSDAENSINSYLSDTISSVFGNVYTVNVRGSTNRELFASDNADIMDIFEKNADIMTEKAAAGESQEYGIFADFMRYEVLPSVVPYESTGLILTDDKAPVELLGMKVIDGMISDELEYYKERFKKDGIDGLIS